MSEITSAFSSLATVFAVFGTLAVMVAVVFVGLRWLDKVDGGGSGLDSGPGMDDRDPAERGWYGSTDLGNGYVKVSSEAGDRYFTRDDYERWKEGGMRGNGGKR
jgi:hypothetical protein